MRVLTIAVHGDNDERHREALAKAVEAIEEVDGRGTVIAARVDTERRTPVTGIVDANHALLCGGVFMALQLMQNQTVEPEVIDGNFTNRVFITRGDSRYVVTVQPEGE